MLASKSLSSKLIPALFIIIVGNEFCQADLCAGDEKKREKAVMQIRIINGPFPRSEGCRLDLGPCGRLFDLGGDPVTKDQLRRFLSDPGLLNESKELVINFKLRDTKVSIEQLTNALRVIHDSIPNRTTILYISLRIRKTGSKIRQ